MYKTLILCGLVCMAMCDQQAGDDGDDGTYIPEKYENPYGNGGDNSINRQPQGGYQQQPARQQYPQAQPEQAYYRPSTAQDPSKAAILAESRSQTADGVFSTAYKQEDGVQFKEESDADGTRRGSYSYVDPSGQRRTVSYTAGKHGFAASGDHLPVGPAPAPQYAQPEPEYRPQYNPPPQQVYSPQPQQPVYQQPQQPVYQQPQQPVYQQPQPQPVHHQHQQPQHYHHHHHQPQVKEAVASNSVSNTDGGYTFSSSF